MPKIKLIQIVNHYKIKFYLISFSTNIDKNINFILKITGCFPHTTLTHTKAKRDKTAERQGYKLNCCFVTGVSDALNKFNKIRGTLNTHLNVKRELAQIALFMQ